MERLIGIGVSSGTAAGQALVAIQRSQVLRFPISGERVGRELAALKSARERSREQLTHIRQRIAERAGTDLAAIFDAQLLILEDPLLLDRAATILRTDRVNAEWAVQRALDELAAVFNDTRDPYLRERKGDLHDVAGRLRMNLRNERGGTRDLVEDLDTLRGGPRNSDSLLRACKEITACTVGRRVVRCARGVGHPAGKACSAGARAHGAIAPGVGGD